MNEKGFAATGILYTILVIFILIMFSMLTLLYSRNNLLNKIQNDIETEIINKTDVISPSVAVSVSGNVATITLSDDVGVTAYGVSSSKDIEPTYTEISETKTTTVTWTFDKAEDYVVWVKDAAGNKTSKLFYDVGFVWKFDFSGSSEILEIPVSGTYQLKLYGAQGGGSIGVLGRGGYGGYSYGNIKLDKNTLLYIFVGQRGGTDGTSSYNGGGAAGSYGGVFGGSGGGATDIRKGGTELANRIIIAGGGGGAGSGYDGGAGGGDTGGAGGGTGGTGGTQSSGGTDKSDNGLDGSLGIGSYSVYTNGAGGGGYYGGAGTAALQAGGGGGGSGYVNTTLFINGTYGTTTSTHTDDGNAEITLISR